jgi:superfamily II DNA/RNA helicase
MLTILEKGRARARMPRTLILEPTRELAAQVKENFDRYGAGQKLNVALLIGGVSFGDQDTKLTRGVDVLIATPGRLLDHTERGGLLLTGVELLVIDEADRMLDMGFIPDIERICKLVPFTRQTLLFTATMPAEIRRVTEAFLHNPQRIEVSKPATAAVTVTQSQVPAGREAHQKREVLRQLLRDAKDLQNAIIFCNRKRDVAILYKSLQKHGFSVGALHGDMDQSARTAALDQFRKGELPLLVASDVAARGLDIPEVSHVFNFDVPHHPDDYVHRIGRTGRAGRAGTAISIATSLDQKSIVAIEKLIGTSIPHAESGVDVQESSAQDGDARERRPREGARRGRSSSSRTPRDGEARQPREREARPAREREARPAGEREARPPREEREVRPAGEREARPAREPRETRAAGEREARPAREPREARPAATGEHEARPPRERHARAPRDREARPAAQDARPPQGQRSPPAPAQSPPSIGKELPQRVAQKADSEPADHSHLPAFLLRPVRAPV